MAKFICKTKQNEAIANFIENLSDVDVDDEDDGVSSNEGYY